MDLDEPEPILLVGVLALGEDPVAAATAAATNGNVKEEEDIVVAGVPECALGLDEGGAKDAGAAADAVVDAVIELVLGGSGLLGSGTTFGHGLVGSVTTIDGRLGIPGPETGPDEGTVE